MPWLLLVAALLLHVACTRASEPPTPAVTSDDAPVTVSIVSGRAPAGTVVSLEPAAGPPPLPEGPAVMDQFSKLFVPETLFARVGQPVIFKNSEDQLHNVTVTRSRTGAGIFNISQNQGDVHTQVFEQPGEYTVNCDVHPGMVATLIVTTTPYAMMTGARGTFELANIPHGTYTLRVQAGGRVIARTIEVTGREVDLGDVTRGTGG
jgi:plastocyanin